MTEATGLNQRGPKWIPRKRRNTTTSAVVAAKDIWNPGPVSASGCKTSTSVAAKATPRKVSARRSKSTATNMTATMI